ncbi:trypsin-like serine peptidase [Lysinibacillus xylanilyticus]|uniref:trypsin-like serine peptidase n=1 Tax=Lysinibacillus xylanilyticus TaxID=582475 RepID=UPI0036DACC2E
MSNKENEQQSYVGEDLKALLAYWTPERIKNTQPVKSPNIRNGIKDTKHSSQYVNEIEEIVTLASSEPDDGGDRGVPDKVEDVNAFPYCCAGKIVATHEDGKDYHGTAQFVGHCRMVLTAAHVVRNPTTGEYYKNIVFLAKYKEDPDPSYETFSFEVIQTHDEWIGENRAYDYAFCRTKKTEPNYPKWLALQIGIPTWQLMAIGYPGKSGEDPDGSTMYKVNGVIGKHGGGIVEMKYNPLEKGCSGGFWMKPSIPLLPVVGINSYSPDNDDSIEISPLFDQQTIDLFNKVLDVSSEEPRRCD